jgi:probable HAF family extracellular repeat protein
MSVHAMIPVAIASIHASAGHRRAGVADKQRRHAHKISHLREARSDASSPDDISGFPKVPQHRSLEANCRDKSQLALLARGLLYAVQQSISGKPFPSSTTPLHYGLAPESYDHPQHGNIHPQSRSGRPIICRVDVLQQATQEEEAMMNHDERIPRHKPALLTALLGAALALPTMAGAWEIHDLGVDVSPTDINNYGTIVGARSTATGNVAFRLVSGGSLEDIPVAGATGAEAINDAGQITGNTLTGAYLYDGSAQEWDGYGGYGINLHGKISGNKELVNPYRATPLPLDPAIYSPDRWDNAGIATVYSRGTRDGVYADLYLADDINDNGIAVGTHRRYGLAGSSAFLTTTALGGVTFLPIPYGGNATAINNANKVVGASGTNSTAGAYAHAYLYNHVDGSVTDLGTLNGGLTSSAADINELDQVVGSSWLVTEPTSLSDPTQYHAFLWQGGSMTDLNELIADSSWILTGATAINDNGDIVGTGIRDDGQVHGFLLTNGTTEPPVAAAANEPPVAVASADVTSGKATLTVSFSSAGSDDPDGGIAGYSWDFGDGSAASTDANPAHDYTSSGTYIAVLTVTDNQGLTATAQVDIKVRKGGGKKR